MNLSSFDLNLIRSLDALLHERNVTRAAERVRLTQQAMSGSLKRLREHFDDALLVRVGRELELTPLGEALRMPVRELMLQTGAMLCTVPSFDPAAAKRRFRLAISDYGALTMLPFLMPKLAAEAPSITLEVKLIDAHTFRDTQDGEVDFCVLPDNGGLYADDEGAGLRSEPLYEDDFVCVVDEILSGVGRQISRADYLAMSHTRLELGGGVRSLVTEAWATERISPHVAATATNFVSQLFMVPGTPLVATTQRRLAHAFSLMLPIGIRECPIPIEPLIASLHWHERNDHDPAHVYLRRAVLDAGAALRRADHAGLSAWSTPMEQLLHNP